jgi:hypothetical protein
VKDHVEFWVTIAEGIEGGNLMTAEELLEAGRRIAKA